jgi:myo-inositol-1(or 4)-monophosphatase
MIENILEIIKEAGEVVREGFGKNFSIEYKTNKSNLVTDIDKASEKLIVDYITKKFPTHGIIAEEGSSKEGASDYAWVIDPLDGTTNFAHGLPIFSVSIGIVKGKEIIAGAVYDVMRNEIYTAEKGSGAYANEKRLRVSQNDDLEKSLLVTGFPYDLKNNPHHVIERFNAFLYASRAVRRLGSAAIDFCYVASGVFDGFWEVKLNPWDICAGKLIVEEAGGKVTNFIGEEIDIFSEQILASNGAVHEKMKRILMRFND